MNTASCRSAITFIDVDRGILRYRGATIDHLAEHCTFLVVAYLLIEGELPTAPHFFLCEPATTEIYTLSLHDALPILRGWARRRSRFRAVARSGTGPSTCTRRRSNA